MSNVKTPTPDETPEPSKLYKLGHKVGTHLREKKGYYITAVVSVMSTAALGSAGVVYVKNADTVIAPRIQQILNWKPEAYIVIAALGDPGDVIQDMVTKTIYPSKGDYARKTGADPVMVRRHLKGELPDVNGAQLRVLGKAGHRIPAADVI